MMDAIVGASGFVGASLAKIINAKHFTSANISELADHRPDTVWVAAPSAVKWKANAEPDADAASVRALCESVNSAAPARIVHFSTVDVYGSAQFVHAPDENVLPQPDCPYGANRLWLENNWSADSVQVVRLPGLFGSGLKKNIIFDLINSRNHGAVSLDSHFQWYDMSDFESLVSEINSAGPGVLNIAVEPLHTELLVQSAFPEVQDLCTGTGRAKYDMRSKNGYRFSKDIVIEQIQRYVAACRNM